MQNIKEVHKVKSTAPVASGLLAGPVPCQEDTRKGKPEGKPKGKPLSSVIHLNNYEGL